MILLGRNKEIYCLLLFWHKKNTMSKRRVIGHAAMEYLAPVDVKEFRTGILEAGMRLASLLVVEYPNACLVNDALFGVTDVVECYSLKGKWVTSWDSSACNEFLATDSIREVSGCVSFFDMTCKSLVVHYNFFHRLPCRR